MRVFPVFEVEPLSNAGIWLSQNALLPSRPAGMKIADPDGCQRQPFTCADCRTEEEEHDAMHTIDIQDYARQLLEAHGFHAIAEAAQKARTFEEQGEKDQAKTWRSIEQALMLMRGPNEN